MLQFTEVGERVMSVSKDERIRSFQSYSWVPSAPGTRWWWHTHRTKEAETLSPRE